jgi:fluoride ion exporter CrcB/FEX
VAALSKLLMVGIGGFIGSILRYMLGGYVQQASRSIEFPYGTLAVNLPGWSHWRERTSAFTAAQRIEPAREP